MDGQRRPSILTEVLGDVVCYSFCTDKDEYLGVFLTDLIEVLNEFRTLLKVAADLDNLLNIVVGGELRRTDVDLDEVLQEILDIGQVNPTPQDVTFATCLRSRASARLSARWQRTSAFVYPGESEQRSS